MNEAVKLRLAEDAQDLFSSEERKAEPNSRSEDVLKDLTRRVKIQPLLKATSAVKETESIDSKGDRQRIVALIGRLADNPRPPGCEKLSAQDEYRVRQGSDRIVYSIEDQDLVVYVVKVGHRKDVYRETAVFKGPLT